MFSLLVLLFFLSGDITYDEFVTFFEHTYPLMPPEARYLEKWQKQQTEDNTMTAAPFATDVPVCPPHNASCHVSCYAGVMLTTLKSEPH